MFNKNQMFRAGKGAGASGSFFFFSKNNKFLIKTVSREEKDLILEILDPMIEYFQTVKNQTLLARIFGLYTIHSQEFVPIHLILMENTMRVESKCNEKVVFDIKGS